MAGLKIDFNFEGLDEYLKKLNELGNRTIPMCKRALYDGAAEIGKSAKSAIEALPISFQPNKDFNKQTVNGVSQKQKDGLLAGLGFTKMRTENGWVYLRLGIGGYNNVKTRKYPNGQPNALIANAVNSGTSSRPKTKFIDKAVKSAEGAASAAMLKRFDEDTKALMEK